MTYAKLLFVQGVKLLALAPLTEEEVSFIYIYIFIINKYKAPIFYFIIIIVIITFFELIKLTKVVKSQLALKADPPSSLITFLQETATGNLFFMVFFVF